MTPEATLESRAWLSALSPTTARVLFAASVFGVDFFRAGARAVAPELHPHTVDLALSELLLGGRISLRPGSRFAGEDTWSFVDPRAASLIASTVEPQERARAHGRAAQWLIERGELDASFVAAQWLRSERPEESARWSAEAARAALAERDYSAALAWSERAITAGLDPATEAAMRMIQTGVHDTRGAIEEAEQCAHAAWKIAPAGSMEWFRSASSVAVLAARRMRPEPFRELDPALRAALGQGGTGIAPAGLAFAVLPMLQLGQYGLADLVIARLEDILRFGEHPEPTFPARVYHARALRAGYGDDPETNLRENERAARAYDALGEPRFAMLSWNNYGFAQTSLGDGEGAEKTLRKVIQRASSMGLDRIALSSQHNLGVALTLLGRHQEASAVERAVIDATLSLGDAHLGAMAALYLSRALLAQGDPQGALEAAEPSLSRVAAQPGVRVLSLALRAAALLGTGRAREALDDASEALRVLSTVGTVEEGDALARITYAEARLATGDPVGADGALRDAYSRLMDRADRISDRAREGFLKNIPEHARTVALAREAGITR